MKSRPWLRFSLRTVLVVMTAIALWIGYQANRANQQRKAVEGILAMGGRITYWHEVDANGHELKKPTVDADEAERESIAFSVRSGWLGVKAGRARY